MQRIPGALTIGILLALGFACQTNRGPAHFSEADRVAIRKADETFVKNAKATPRNDKACAAYYEEDAIMLTPNQSPLEGRAAIEAFLSSFPLFSDYRLEVAEIEGSGDLAYERGSASMTLSSGGEKPTQWRSQYLIIWRKQVDGSWKVSREIFTPDAPSEI